MVNEMGVSLSGPLPFILWKVGYWTT
uniref:Uncharacterized protein n=1 Tax=Rhizophora mucronata TaxID=61149 RepID=A0A2P2PZR0_RHIMU